MNTNPIITRRAALLGAAVSSAALAMPVMAMAGRAPGAVTERIEAHRRAYQAYDEAVKVHGDRDAALMEENQRNPILAPLAVKPDGKMAVAGLELRTYNAAAIRAEIDKTHDALRKTHCSTWMMTTAPAQAEVILAEINASHERALCALEEALQAYADREAAFGVTTALARSSELSQAETEARFALIMCRPTTPAEAAAKRAYMAEAEAFVERWDDEQGDFTRRILAALCEVA